ncbi:MAG: hypothetical protein AB7H97_14060, partial [Pseudobdellovibrionaceae bacterium]
MSERRTSKRKELTPLSLENIVSLDNFAKIAKAGAIVDASTNGFRIHVKHSDLVPVALRQTLTLDSLVGMKILL